jgi:TRAP-type C4-dicarboxylate transport system permease small subunit
MTALWKLCEHVSRVAVWIGAALLIAAACIVSAEVILRKGFATVAFTGSDEIASYLFAVGTSLSMAYVLVTRGHVRIDALYGLFGPRTRALLDVLALVVLAVFLIALTERAFDVTMTSLTENSRSNTPLRIPVGIPQAGWLAGIVLFLAVLAVAILRSVVALIQGDLATVRATAGASSQDEEIESELKSLGIEMPKHSGPPPTGKA